VHTLQHKLSLQRVIVLRVFPFGFFKRGTFFADRHDLIDRNFGFLQRLLEERNQLRRNRVRGRRGRTCRGWHDP
jgi:hypothetical protein